MKLAARIGIGRSTYFEVKAGRGGKKARRRTEECLRSLQITQKPDLIGTFSGLLPVPAPLRTAAPAAAGRDAAEERRRDEHVLAVFGLAVGG